jgi:hypothetical protein
MQRRCIFTSTLSSKAKCIADLHGLLENILVMHSSDP